MPPLASQWFHGETRRLLFFSFRAQFESGMVQKEMSTGYAELREPSRHDPHHGYLAIWARWICPPCTSTVGGRFKSQKWQRQKPPFSAPWSWSNCLSPHHGDSPSKPVDANVVWPCSFPKCNPSNLSDHKKQVQKQVHRNTFITLTILLCTANQTFIAGCKYIVINLPSELRKGQSQC